MQSIVENSADGIVILNQQGVIQLLNPAAEKLFNRSARELVGSVFGFPLVAGEFSEVDLISADGLIAVEMRVSEIEWAGRAGFLAALRDVTERRRITEELHQAIRFNEAVLNSLTSHIAVVARDGTILAANRAWESFAQANGDPYLLATGTGANYFEVCRRAAEGGDEMAGMALDGMLAVLHGHRATFELEYPCHAPEQQRWFVMRVTVFTGSSESGLVISHTDTTAPRYNTRQQVQTEFYAAHIEHQQQELSSLEALARSSQPPAEETAHTLREKMPDHFSEVVSRCETLLDKAVQQRTYEVSYPLSDELRALAEYLGLLKAGPRDVMEVYLAALRSRVKNSSAQKAGIYVEEGRILVLELMGYLAGFYRNCLPPVIRSPAP